MHDFANSSLSVSGEVEHSFVVTDAPMGLLDKEIRLIADYVALVAGPVLGIFGIGSNTINIIIFYRQGLDNTINVSFFNLAISDLGSMIFMIVCSVCTGPPVVNADISLDFPTVIYLFGGWQHIWFATITSWITVYITAERCLCVAQPLKVKEIITPRVTSFIISVIYLVAIMGSVPDFIYIYLDWTFIPKRNRTIISLLFRENFRFLSGASQVIWTILAFLPFPVTIVFTVILVVKLRQQTLWRQKSTHDRQKAQLTSTRELRTMHTVVLIAVVLIICYIPGVFATITSYAVPDFNVNGRYANSWWIFYYIVFIMHSMNSNVNIFLYYKMSSKFKRDFHQLFKHCISAPGEIDDAD